MKTITSFRTTSSSGGEAYDHQLPSVPSLLLSSSLSLCLELRSDVTPKLVHSGGKVRS